MNTFSPIQLVPLLMVVVTGLEGCISDGQPFPEQAINMTPELTSEDLVFIRMHTDKTTVAIGEPVLLTLQLWRIKHPKIQSGPYRGGKIVNPTLEGFSVEKLDTMMFEKEHNSRVYDVAESRKLLYPSRAGTLHTGAWHWEGLSITTKSIGTERDKVYHALDVGSIELM